MAAGAGRAYSDSIAKARREESVSLRMGWALELVGAVRAYGQDVLQQELAIALSEARVIPGVLGTEARELAQAPVDHDGGALGRGRGERRECIRRQEPRAHQRNVGRP